MSRRLKKYTVKQDHLTLVAGDVVYELAGHDFGSARDDSMMMKTPCISITLNENGDYPYVTIPISCLEESLSPFSVEIMERIDALVERIEGEILGSDATNHAFIDINLEESESDVFIVIDAWSIHDRKSADLLRKHSKEFRESVHSIGLDCELLQSEAIGNEKAITSKYKLTNKHD